MSTQKKLEQGDNETANYVDRGHYRGHQQQLPTHYHPNLRNYENFSYANNRNVLQGPPSFSNVGPSHTKKRSNLEDLMVEFIKESRGRTTALESTVQSHGKTIHNIEVQISQIATSLQTM